ncbi:MAG: response regulator [Flavobacteriales bacterium]
MNFSQQKHILLVDDEAIILNVLKHHVKRFIPPNVEVVTAMSGEEAITIVKDILDSNGLVCCVISDYLMHPMRGSDLLIELESMIPRTKKIMLTGQADLQAVADVLTKIHLFRYIAKPWEPQDLELTVNEALKMFDYEIELHIRNKELENIQASLEEKVALRTQELQRKNSELEQGLQYARYIQECFLPDTSEAWQYLKNLYIFNSPAASISGDFAWYRMVNNQILFALGDSTGHGLAGALITVLATDILSEKTVHHREAEPLKHIVAATISDLQGRLRTDAVYSELSLGIDLVLVRIDLKSKDMEWASLNGNILLVGQDDKVEVLSKAKGFFHLPNYENNIQTGITNIAEKKVVMCSDGLYDQLNGTTGKRLKLSGLIHCIEEGKVFSNGVCLVDKCFDVWKHGTDQTDDAMWISFEV